MGGSSYKTHVREILRSYHGGKSNRYHLDSLCRQMRKTIEANIAGYNWTGKEVKVEQTIDPNFLGGLVVEFGQKSGHVKRSGGSYINPLN